MKAFLAYRGSGEDEQKLLDFLSQVVKTLAHRGVIAHCTHLEGKTAPDGQKMRSAFRNIDESDVLIVLVTSADKSEGMLLEIGYAFGTNKPIQVFTKPDVSLASFELADDVVRWTDTDDLLETLESYYGN